MSEPGLNPTSESGSDVLEDLSPARARPPTSIRRITRRPRPPAIMPAPPRPRSRSGPRTKTKSDGERRQGSRRQRRETWRPGFSPGLVRWPRVAGSAAKQGFQFARRYPRASMASGLSAAILSGVMVLQPGKGKHDTTAAIRNTAAHVAGRPGRSSDFRRQGFACREVRRPRARLGPGDGRLRPAGRVRGSRPEGGQARTRHVRLRLRLPVPDFWPVRRLPPRRPASDAPGNGLAGRRRSSARSRPHRDHPLACR